MNISSSFREGLLDPAEVKEESQLTASSTGYVPPEFNNHIMTDSQNTTSNQSSNNIMDSYSHSQKSIDSGREELPSSTEKQLLSNTSSTGDDIEAESLPSPPTPMKKMISDPITNAEKISAWATIVAASPQIEGEISGTGPITAQSDTTIADNPDTLTAGSAVRAIPGGGGALFRSSSAEKIATTDSTLPVGIARGPSFVRGPLLVPAGSVDRLGAGRTVSESFSDPVSYQTRLRQHLVNFRSSPASPGRVVPGRQTHNASPHLVHQDIDGVLQWLGFKGLIDGSGQTVMSPLVGAVQDVADIESGVIATDSTMQQQVQSDVIETFYCR